MSYNTMIIFFVYLGIKSATCLWQDGKENPEKNLKSCAEIKTV